MRYLKNETTTFLVRLRVQLVTTMASTSGNTQINTVTHENSGRTRSRKALNDACNEDVCIGRRRRRGGRAPTGKCVVSLASVPTPDSTGELDTTRRFPVNLCCEQVLNVLPIKNPPVVHRRHDGRQVQAEEHTVLNVAPALIHRFYHILGARMVPKIKLFLILRKLIQLLHALVKTRDLGVKTIVVTGHNSTFFFEIMSADDGRVAGEKSKAQIDLSNEEEAPPEKQQRLDQREEAACTAALFMVLKGDHNCSHDAHNYPQHLSVLLEHCKSAHPQEYEEAYGKLDGDISSACYHCFHNVKTVVCVNCFGTYVRGYFLSKQRNTQNGRLLMDRGNEIVRLAKALDEEKAKNGTLQKQLRDQRKEIKALRSLYEIYKPKA